MRVSGAIAVAIAAAVLALSAHAAETRRELGAHRHGHGTVNLAIEGTRVLIELEAPAADIVGFEHPARSREDRAAVEKATATLKAPLALFALPGAAGCRVEAAEVTLAGASGHDHESHAHERGHSASTGHGEDTHSEFHAEYVLACDSPDAIAAIAFPYFETFPRARTLNVNVITAAGQTRHEVARDAARIELKRAR